MPMLKWCNLQTEDINGVAIGKCGGNRHCSVLLIRTLHPHICKLAVGDGTMHECSAPVAPLALWLFSRLSYSVRSTWHCKGQYPSKKHEQGLECRKTLARGGNRLYERRIRLRKSPYRKNPGTPIRDVSSFETLSLS